MIKEFQWKYRWLSNFWPVQIKYKGRIFHNVENAYHSEKSNDEHFKNYCAQESNSRELIKNVQEMVTLRSDWEEVKVEIMEELLALKFSNEPFRTQLMETGDEYIQEGNTWGDVFWGVNVKTGEGKNMLGEIIMKIRNELKNE